MSKDLAVQNSFSLLDQISSPDTAGSQQIANGLRNQTEFRPTVGYLYILIYEILILHKET